MQHNLRRTSFGPIQCRKQASTAERTSASVAKYRLCSARRLVSFQTRSIGASCGLYGGRNSNVKCRLYLRSSGLSMVAWWYLALSSTTTMRLPRRRWRSSWRRKDTNVSALKTGHTCQTKRPVLRLTAPKHATDLRVGACINTGSRTSGATHMRQRDPCCWKWHSSRLHNSTSSRFARRRSFFYSRNPDGIRLGDLRARFAQPKTHLAKQPLALSHAQLDAVALTQVLRQNGPIPQARFKSEVAWRLAQVSLNASPLRFIQRTRTSGPFTFP